MAAYLEAALEEGDPALVAAALGDIARAKGMAQIARETGLGRESLYKALSPEGNPEFATVLKVVRALGHGCAPPRRTPKSLSVNNSNFSPADNGCCQMMQGDIAGIGFLKSEPRAYETC